MVKLDLMSWDKECQEDLPTARRFQGRQTLLDRKPFTLWEGTTNFTSFHTYGGKLGIHVVTGDARRFEFKLLEPDRDGVNGQKETFKRTSEPIKGQKGSRIDVYLKNAEAGILTIGLIPDGSAKINQLLGKGPPTVTVEVYEMMPVLVQ